MEHQNDCRRCHNVAATCVAIKVWVRPEVYCTRPAFVALTIVPNANPMPAKRAFSIHSVSITHMHCSKQVLNSLWGKQERLSQLRVKLANYAYSGHCKQVSHEFARGRARTTCQTKLDFAPTIHYHLRGRLNFRSRFGLGLKNGNKDKLWALSTTWQRATVWHTPQRRCACFR